MYSRINAKTGTMEKTSAATAVTQADIPGKRPREIFSNPVITMKTALTGREPKKALGATVNSSKTTFPAPKCDANSFFMIVARSRSWALPGKPGPASVQMVLTIFISICGIIGGNHLNHGPPLHVFLFRSHNIFQFSVSTD